MEQSTVEKQPGNPLATQSIGTLIRKYSWPAIVGGVVSAIYNIVDQIYIGWGIGELGMAATNVAFPLTTISLAMALWFGVGAASNMSLSLGKGDPKQAKHIAGNALVMLIVSGILIAGIGIIFLRPLLRLFGGTPSMMPYAEPYTLIIALGIPFYIISTGASHMIRADGSPTYSMLCMTAGAVFNLIADPLFLFGFGMGIEGIALATSLGQLLSMVLALYYLVRKAKVISLSKIYLRLRKSTLRAICMLGAAACVNQLAMTLVQIVMNNTLTHYGGHSAYGSEVPLAVVGAVSKINVLFMVVILGVAQGCQPIIGFNYGARDYRRVKETYRKAVIAISIYSFIAFLCFQLFPNQIMSIFGTGSEAYYTFAARYMRVYMGLLFLVGAQVFTSNFFTAIGKSVLGLIMSLTRQVLLLTPLLLILPIFWGLDGVLYAGPISDGGAFILAALFIIREMRRMTEMERSPGTRLATDTI